MGNQLEKYANMDIQLDEPYYYAGNTMTGRIYLQVRQAITCSWINLNISGVEIFKGDAHTIYTFTFNLHNFTSKLNPKQYSYPFKFQLPSTLCGSFFSTNQKFKCGFQYSLTTTLCDQHTGKKIERSIQFQVIEPIRIRQYPKSIHRSNHHKYSFCCLSKIQGDTKVSLTSEKSFIVGEQNFKIKGSIDNRRCLKKIKQYTISLQEKLFAIKDNRISHSKQQIFDLLKSNQPISPGSVEKIAFETKIPATNTGYTAIGTKTGRYYVIQLAFSYQETPQMIQYEMHIVFQSNDPKIINQNKSNFQSWNPMQFPLVSCQLPPFVYSPTNNVPYLNRDTGIGKHRPSKFDETNIQSNPNYVLQDKQSKNNLGKQNIPKQEERQSKNEKSNEHENSHEHNKDSHNDQNRQSNKKTHENTHEKNQHEYKQCQRNKQISEKKSEGADQHNNCEKERLLAINQKQAHSLTHSDHEKQQVSQHEHTLNNQHKFDLNKLT